MFDTHMYVNKCQRKCYVVYVNWLIATFKLQIIVWLIDISHISYIYYNYCNFFIFCAFSLF